MHNGMSVLFGVFLPACLPRIVRREIAVVSTTGGSVTMIWPVSVITGSQSFVNMYD